MENKREWFKIPDTVEGAKLAHWLNEKQKTERELQTREERYSPNTKSQHWVIDGLWHLHNAYSVEDAAALIAGYPPEKVALCRIPVSDSGSDTAFFETTFPRFYIARTAIINAIQNKNELQATLRYAAKATEEKKIYGMETLQTKDAAINLGESDWENPRADDLKNGGVAVEGENGQKIYVQKTPNWKTSTISKDDLVNWLSSKGVRTGFFFPDATDTADYLNPCHPRYSTKLAAAIKAWEAMEDENLRRGKSAKNAMQAWLESRYLDLGLIHDGKINNEGIKEVAKIANWETGGGATKTPE